MKLKTVNLFLNCLVFILLTAVLCAPVSACAYEGQKARAWHDHFAKALAGMNSLNDPAMTADPARAGEYLLEYEFGTVTAKSAAVSEGGEILSIDVRTEQVTDWRGMRVGMALRDVLGGKSVGASSTQLYVLDVLPSGRGWSWAYVDDRGVYGIEYIAYDGENAEMTEYTLTYVIEDGRISAIRIKSAPATQAQIQEGLLTAKEIASRQHGEVLVKKNERRQFAAEDASVMGAMALGAEVADLVMRLGEPNAIQTLPEGGGRILLYDGVVVSLDLNVYTGAEVVRGVSVTDEKVLGPRGLMVGMSVQEAAALFRCDQDVSSLGGVMYLEGEAMGEAPYGELRTSVMDDVTLRYACLAQKREEVILEISVQDGAVTYWHLFFASDRREEM